jgi:lysophospholipase L1-like esterase
MAVTLAAGWLLAGSVQAQTAAVNLPPKARLAIVGDSITEGRQYSRVIEAYLIACAGRTDLSIFNYGWSGETAGGFANRMENDLAPFKPTVATFCFGMNDGGYRLYEENIGRNYENNMRRILTSLAAMQVKDVVVGTPGAVDSQYFKTGQKFAGDIDAHAGYNESLRQLGLLDAKLAAEFKVGFADVHQPMMDAMVKGKAALGAEYDVCGRDGVHPGPNGGLVMAYALLRGLGCTGDIGTFAVDLKGTATATDGHKILSAANGKVEIESTRYPFCFDADAKSAGSTRSILPFLPFNQELNRLVLKVTNLDAPKAKVTWGSESREFTKEQLTAGVNLAAEFAKTPFDGEFLKFLNAVSGKQGFDIQMIKGVVTQFRWLNDQFKDDAELKSAQQAIIARLVARREQLERELRAQLQPLKHTIEITSIP